MLGGGGVTRRRGGGKLRESGKKRRKPVTLPSHTRLTSFPREIRQEAIPTQLDRNLIGAFPLSLFLSPSVSLSVCLSFPDLCLSVSLFPKSLSVSLFP